MDQEACALPLTNQATRFRQKYNRPVPKPQIRYLYKLSPGLGLTGERGERRGVEDASDVELDDGGEVGGRGVDAAGSVPVLLEGHRRRRRRFES